MPVAETIQIGDEAVSIPVVEYNIAAMREVYPLMQTVFAGWAASPEDGADPLVLTLACIPVVAFALRVSRPDLTAAAIEDRLLPSQCQALWLVTTQITKANGFKPGEAAAPGEQAAPAPETGSTETSTL